MIELRHAFHVSRAAPTQREVARASARCPERALPSVLCVSRARRPLRWLPRPPSVPALKVAETRGWQS